jgi:hypothetical protein
MELNATQEATSCVATLYFLSILWNQKVHYRIQKSYPLVPVVTQTNPVHTTPSHLPKIHINIVHLPMFWYV